MHGVSRTALVIALGLAPALLAASSASAALSLSGDLAVPEGSGYSTQVTLTLSDDVASPWYRCVSLRTVDGSATAGSVYVSDYQAVFSTGSPCLSWGALSTTLPFTIWADGNFEPDESFSVEISDGYFGAPLAPEGPYPIADGHAEITLRNDDVPPVVSPPSDPAAPPPLEHAWTDPKDCTVAYMKERYAAGRPGVPDAPEFHGEGQFFGLMRVAAKNLGPGGITELLAGRGKFTNVLTCPTGTLLGRVHKLRPGKRPLLLAAGRFVLDYRYAGRVSVRLRLTKHGRSVLEGRSRLRVRATVRHVDLQGTAAQRRVRVTLTR